MATEFTPLNSIASPSPSSSTTATSQRRQQLFQCGLAVLGPGLLCSLADTDAACLLVAADSGARFGFSALVTLQLFLIAPLFLAQELTVRLGVHTGLGHCACVRLRYGAPAAWLICVLLLVTAVLAIVSEFSGIAGVGAVAGLPPTAAAAFAAMLMLLIVPAPYRVVEAIGIALGLFEFAFVVAWGLSGADAADFARGLVTVSDDPMFAGMVVANTGAVIMPWMLFFQQSAIAARKLQPGRPEAVERTGTLVGSFATQLIMVATMATLAATRHRTGVYAVASAPDMARALDAALGAPLGRIVLMLGLLGGSLCATIVVALAAAWALSDALGHADKAGSPNPMDLPVHRAPAFYGGYVAVVLLGLGVQLACATLEQVSLVATFANTLLMVSTLGVLWHLACADSGHVALPAGVRVTGLHKWGSAAIFGLCAAVGLGAMAYSLVGAGGGAGMAGTVRDAA